MNKEKQIKEPRIETIEAKTLIGQCLKMSMIDNKTGQLWSRFMPRRKEIQNQVNSDLISLQVYPTGYFNTFDPRQQFVKWALVEVSPDTNVPRDMQIFQLGAGDYAVFSYRGSSADQQRIADFFQYIFGTWLPGSEFQLDQRPHFEVLGSSYLNGSADSEEEVWIPVIKL